jgi:hypothetical protein
MTHDWALKGEIYEVKELIVSNDRKYPTNYIKQSSTWVKI